MTECSGGEVVANGYAVVMLKASYHPRWTVKVDGKPDKTQMLAPSLVEGHNLTRRRVAHRASR
jgi:hypothetical protein